jgi:hypothetical protein
MLQNDILARSKEAGNGYRWCTQEDFYFSQQYIDIDKSMVDYDPRTVLTSSCQPLLIAFRALIFLILRYCPFS